VRDALDALDEDELRLALARQRRRLALNLAKLESSKASMKGKLYRAALSEAFLTRLLAQFGKNQMR